MEKGAQVFLDIDNLTAIVRKDLETLGLLSKECCIYKVPQRLRMLNEKDYPSRVVSIGPFHHGKKELRAMEEHKRMYLQDFLKLSSARLEDFINLIGNSEAKLLHCYAETFGDLSSEQFVKMVLVDAAFIIMVIRYFSTYALFCHDRIFSPPWLITEVWYDMCLLEYQLPFFILQDLLELSKIFNPQKLIIYTHEFFKLFWGAWVTTECEEILSSSKIEHFVDFLRIYQQLTRPDRERKPKRLTTSNAKMLHQAGVKFQFASSQNLLHIAFKKENILEIPKFSISDNTEMLLRNLQAFEQCHWGTNYLGHYIYTMDLLADSTEDVEILVRNGIIKNLMSNNEAVATLSYNLSKENSISDKNFYSSDVLVDLNDYCGRDWPKWKANLRHNYFQNPWS